MSTGQIKDIVSQIKKLPTLPSVANKVNNLIQDPTCTAIKLAEVLNKDQRMLEVLKRRREKDITFVDAEQEVMGLNHTDIGGQVMTNWNIPVPVVVAVKHHHQKVEDRNGSDFAQDLIVDIVRLSDVICKCEHIGYNGDTVETELTDDLWERLALDSGAIKKIIAASEGEVEKASILMDLT